MADRPPRPSNDQESAPLLQDSQNEQRDSNQDSSFSQRVEAIAQEPLTPLTKVLLVLALVLLLLSSVFIGLFAGIRHKLDLERERHPGGGEPTVTGTITATVTATSTQSTGSTTTITRTSYLPPAPVPTNPPKEEICLTPQCILLSGAILASLDTSRDPCENFYDFANGGWLKNHPLPQDKAVFGEFEALAQQNRKVVQRILEATSTPASKTSYDAQVLRKLRDFYTSCVHEDTLNKIGDAPLQQVIHSLRKIYRNTFLESGNRDEKKGDLTAALAYLHSQGIDALLSFEVEGDVGKDPNLMVLWVSQPELGLPSKEYYKDKSVLKVYQDVVARLLLSLSQDDAKSESVQSSRVPVGFVDQEGDVWPPWPWPPWDEDEDDKDGSKNNTRRAHKLAMGVLELEKQLAKASLDLEVLVQDPLATYNPRPLLNFTKSIPQVDFPTYFSSMSPGYLPEIVIVTHPVYMSSLGKILDETPPGVLEAYFAVRAALTLAPNLGRATEAWQAHRTLYELLSGVKKGAVGDRSEFCVGKVEETLGFAIGRYFVNETFGEDSREAGTKIITNIIQSFKSSLSHVKWMDKTSSKAAAEKANAIRVKVGYPLSPDTRDAESIANYYKGIGVDSINFFENVISATKDAVSKNWLRLGQRRDIDLWEMVPSQVNAYFNPPANEIVFPAGILQPPFFQYGWPSYIAYGAFGHVASHELTHAFDSAGRLYNQQGKLEEWWTNNTSEGFKVKQKCIVEQFSAYTIDDGKGGKIHVNGNLTSGENIGDTGLIQAYRAWKSQYGTSNMAGKELLLPGLAFTKEQLFFIAFARIWARAMTPAAAVQRVRTDPHSPSRFRVDGTVSNIPEFAAAFKCSKKAKLNPPPEARCLFW